MFYKIVDLPPLPDELINEALEIVYTSDPYHARTVYSRYPASDQIVSWCQKNISSSIVNNFKIGIQTFSDNPTFPHTDGKRGTKSLNFLLKAGGNNVETIWYQEKGHSLTQVRGKDFDIENLEEQCRIICPVHQWMVIQTDIIHHVVNLTEKRIALSIGLEEDEYNLACGSKLPH
jgi:hypothetical protein